MNLIYTFIFNRTTLYIETSKQKCILDLPEIAVGDVTHKMKRR